MEETLRWSDSDRQGCHHLLYPIRRTGIYVHPIFPLFIQEVVRVLERASVTVAYVHSLAEQHGSAVEVEEWGSRKLAYPINYKTEGYYVLMTFTSEPSFPKELDRVLRITDGIMRSLIVCKGE